MSYRFGWHSPLDGFESLSDSEAEFFLPSVWSGASSVISPPPLVLPAEAVEAQAAQNGSGGPGSVTAVTSSGGGITIYLIFDAAAMAAPASFRAGIQQAAMLLSSAISDKITVNLNIDYSGTGGGAAAGPDNGQFVSYSTVRADLINNATPGDTSFNSLPTGSTIQGQSQVAVWNAQLKLWGLLGANDTTSDDGSATFATDINPNLLVGVALHELTHALGRVPYGPQPDIFDFYRFASVGTRLFSGNATAPAAYFSLNGGSTKIADYGQTSDPSDFLNSGVQGPNDPFNEFYSNNTLQQLTTVDLKQLDALGFHTATLDLSVVQTAGQAIQGSSAIALLSATPMITNTAGSILSAATIKVANTSGNPVTGDELYVNGLQSGTVDGGLVSVSWNAVTETLTLTGAASLTDYQTLLSGITYLDSGTDSSTGSHPQRTVTWTINDGTASTSTTSQVTIERPPVATVSNVTLANATAVGASSLVTASDPDNDTISTYAFKDTGNGHFVLNGVSQPNNQEIDVTAAQLSQLTYQSAGGADTVQVRVYDGTLWSGWQSFTVTGLNPVVIQTDGTTALTEVGNIYYLYTSGSGPSLTYGGAAVTAGEFGTWTPIGAIQVSGGYDVAWKDPGSGQYTAWSTDSNGNYQSHLIGGVSGNSLALETLETTFHQDLNGDGVIGIPSATRPTVAQLFGAQSGSPTFEGATLTLDDPSAFNVQIIGFSGDGTLPGSDKIDLHGFNFNFVHSSLDSSTGIFVVNDGSTTANLQFLGHYSPDNFKFANDGKGGTIVYASFSQNHTDVDANQATGSSPSGAATISGHDTFVFAPHFGQVSIANFAPATDSIQFDKSVFPNITALVTAIHDDSSNNALITDSAHDTITVQHVTIAQLLAHQSVFHIV